MIARKQEQEILFDISVSKKAEFVAVYGRRRVGKTYLIKEFYKEDFSFYSTGVYQQPLKTKLKVFNDSLLEFGSKDKKVPKDWFEAFNRLKNLIKDGTIKKNSEYGKFVLFLDEVPWMDGKKSSFKSALDIFWNTFASTNKDIVLIVCGSATSWMIKNMFRDKGGFHNRITNQIHLFPFTLKECEEYFLNSGTKYSHQQLIDIYTVFGGVPLYLSLINPRYNLAQNIENLLFNENGRLHYELNDIFASLDAENYDDYLKVIMTLSQAKNGLSRNSIIEKNKKIEGKMLTKILLELEECGFIRKYVNYITHKNNAIYQLIDPFILFANRFLANQQFTSWKAYYNTSSYYSWRGNAFEIVVLNHIKELKSALGINGIQSMNYAFQSKKSASGAQIDLIIERNDNVTNICEIKMTNGQFELDKESYLNFLNKIEVFKDETKTRATLQPVLISSNGLKENQYSDVFPIVIDNEFFFN